MPYAALLGPLTTSRVPVHLLGITTHCMRRELCEVETSQDDVSVIMIHTETGRGWKVDQLERSVKKGQVNGHPRH